jgi:hypothetical protein
MQDGRGGSKSLHNLPSIIPAVSTYSAFGSVSAFSAAGLVSATGAETVAGSAFESLHENSRGRAQSRKAARGP